MIYKPGYKFKKTGVIVRELVPETTFQMGMFDHSNRHKDAGLMQALDNINVSYGKDTLRYAVQHFTNKWRLRTAKLSPNYTIWKDMYCIS